jgi:hypothetical protein
LVAATDDWLHDVPHTTVALEVAPPLRATLVRPGETPPDDELVMVARVLVASDDGTVQHIAFAVGGDMVASEAEREGCTALARAMARTLTAGDRRVDTSARTVSVGDGLVVDVPAGYALLPQPGPDFTVSYLYPIVPLGAPHAQLGVYLGEHASSHARDVTDLHEEPGRLFAATVPFRVWTTPNEHRGRTHHEEAIAEVPGGEGRIAHVFFVVEDDARIPELRAIAESLRRESP